MDPEASKPQPSIIERAKQKASEKAQAAKDRTKGTVNRIRDRIATGDEDPVEVMGEEVAAPEPVEPHEPVVFKPISSVEAQYEEYLSPKTKVEKPIPVKKERVRTLDEQVREEFARIRNFQPPKDEKTKKDVTGIDVDVARFKEKRIKDSLPQEVKDEMAKRLKNRMDTFYTSDELQALQGQSTERSTPTEPKARSDEDFGERIKELNRQQKQEVVQKIDNRDLLNVWRKDWDKYSEDQTKAAEFDKKPPADRLPKESYFAYTARKQFEASPPSNARPGESRDDYVLRGGPEELEEIKRKADAKRKTSSKDPFERTSHLDPYEMREKIITQKKAQKEQRDLLDRERKKNEEEEKLKREKIIAQRPPSVNPFASKNPLSTPKIFTDEEAEKARISQIANMGTSRNIRSSSGEYISDLKHTPDSLFKSVADTPAPKEGLWAKVRNRFRRKETSPTEATTETVAPQVNDTEYDKWLNSQDDGFIRMIRDADVEENENKPVLGTTPDPESFATLDDEMPKTTEPQDDDIPPGFYRGPKLRWPEPAPTSPEPPSGPNTQTELENGALESLSVPDLNALERKLRMENIEVYDSDRTAITYKIDRIKSNKNIEPAKEYIDVIQETGVTQEIIEELSELGVYCNIDMKPEELINILRTRTPREARISEKTKKELEIELKALDSAPENAETNYEKQEIKDTFVIRDIDAAQRLLRQFDMHESGWNRDPFPMSDVLFKLTGNIPADLTPEMFKETLQKIANTPMPPYRRRPGSFNLPFDTR